MSVLIRGIQVRICVRDGVCVYVFAQGCVWAGI